MLAAFRSDNEVDITGVIDWDFAAIIPEFMAYSAPFWLWTADDAESDFDTFESNAIIEPTADECRELKQVFLDHASEKYKRYAFAPEAILARRMYLILQKGLYSSWTLQEAKDVILAWSELHPEDRVEPVQEGSDDDSDDDSFCESDTHAEGDNSDDLS